MKNTGKPLSAKINNTGGYDLITERDGGNDVQILTGNFYASHQYWVRLANLANEVIDEMERNNQSDRHPTING